MAYSIQRASANRALKPGTLFDRQPLQPCKDTSDAVSAYLATESAHLSAASKYTHADAFAQPSNARVSASARPSYATWAEIFSLQLYRLDLCLIEPCKKTTRTEIFQCAFGKLGAPLSRLFDSGSGLYAATDYVTLTD